MILKPRPFRKLRYGPHWSKTGLVYLGLYNEGDGDEVLDLSGNGHTGTFLGGPSWGAANFGTGIDFDASASGRISVPNSNLLTFNSATQDFTIVAWIMIRDISMTNYIINMLDGGNDGWRLYMSTANQLLQGSIDVYDTTSTNTLTQGVWQQVAWSVKRSSTNTLFIDGLPDGTDTTAGGAMSIAGDMVIGNRSYSESDTYNLEGLIDHVLLYNRALTAPEIAQLYINPFIMFDRDEIELWAAATQGVVVAGNAGIMTTNTGYWGPTF